MKTRDKLAAELRKVAAVASPENAAKYETFAKRAATGEFDDYADTYACPITQLYSELTAAGFTKFAARVANGEFDATKEESDEWANSPSGRETFSHLSPEARKVLLGQDDKPKQPERLGDAPIDDAYREMMNAVASGLDKIFNGETKGPDRKVAFVLLVAEFGELGRCNFISNGIDRKDVVSLMREMIARFEGQPEMKGHA